MLRQLHRVATPIDVAKELGLLNGDGPMSPMKSKLAPRAVRGRRTPVSTPVKCVKPVNRLSRLMAAAVAAPVVEEKTAVPPSNGVTDVEQKALRELFVGLDAVLQLQTSRNRRAELASVRADTEARTGRSLSDARLAMLLTLGEGLVEARWHGVGPSAKLQLFARGEDGKERASDVEEQQRRHTCFEERLAAAVAAGSLSSCELPSRPQSAAERFLTREASDDASAATLSVASPAPKSTPAPSASPSASPAQRLASLRQRVREREAAARSPAALAGERLRRQLRTCEDAAAVHGVVAQLFAAGAAADTSDRAVVRAACSERRAAYPMDQDRATEAVAHLASKARSWFRVEESQYTAGLRHFKQIEMCSPTKVLDDLKCEGIRLAEELASLGSAQTSAPVAAGDARGCKRQVGAAADYHPTKRRRCTGKRPRAA